MRRKAVLRDFGALDRPEATIHQPTAPCNAPRAKISHNRRFNFAGNRRATGTTGTAAEGRADGTAEQAMAPFPPEDGLELVQAHPGD